MATPIPTKGWLNQHSCLQMSPWGVVRHCPEIDWMYIAVCAKDVCIWQLAFHLFIDLQSRTIEAIKNLFELIPVIGSGFVQNWVPHMQ